MTNDPMTIDADAAAIVDAVRGFWPHARMTTQQALALRKRLKRFDIDAVTGALERHFRKRPDETRPDWKAVERSLYDATNTEASQSPSAYASALISEFKRSEKTRNIPTYLTTLLDLAGRPDLGVTVNDVRAWLRAAQCYRQWAFRCTFDSNAAVRPLTLPLTQRAARMFTKQAIEEIEPLITFGDQYLESSREDSLWKLKRYAAELDGDVPEAERMQLDDDTPF